MFYLVMSRRPCIPFWIFPFAFGPRLFICRQLLLHPFWIFSFAFGTRLFSICFSLLRKPFWVFLFLLRNTPYPSRASLLCSSRDTRYYTPASLLCSSRYTRYYTAASLLFSLPRYPYLTPIRSNASPYIIFTDGWCGASFGSVPAANIAGSVTSYGRKMIFDTADYGRKHYGAEIIYGGKCSNNSSNNSKNNSNASF